MIVIAYLLIFLATFDSCVETTSNNTLLLPITINPLIQDSMQLGDISKMFLTIAKDKNFYRYVTFSDIVKKQGSVATVEIRKNVQGLVILAHLAEQDLTTEELEFLNTSKWAINMTVEELANASDRFILPLNDTIHLVTIQEAMFKILGEKFNFTIEEVVERLRKNSTDEVYAFLEPGWIKVVNFITEKNILVLSMNYSIPPYYIAEALNMSLVEMYNSTLPQLEDILTNKIDVIKEAAERFKRSSSVIVGTSSIVTTSLPMNSTATLLPTNRTASVIEGKSTTMAIQPSFATQTTIKTSSNQNEISSYQPMNNTFSKDVKSTLPSSYAITPHGSSMPDFTSFKVSTMEIETPISSISEIESSFVPQVPKSTETKSQSTISSKHTGVSTTGIQVLPSRSSSTLSESSKNQISTSHQDTSMIQPSTPESALPSSTAIVLAMTNTKSSMLAKGSKITSMPVSHTSSPVLSQLASLQMVEMSSSQHMTTSQLLPTPTTQLKSSFSHTSSPVLSQQALSQMVELSSSQHMTTSQILPTPITKLKSLFGHTSSPVSSQQASSQMAEMSSSQPWTTSQRLPTPITKLKSLFGHTSSPVSSQQASSQMAEMSSSQPWTASQRLPTPITKLKSSFSHTFSPVSSQQASSQMAEMSSSQPWTTSQRLPTPTTQLKSSFRLATSSDTVDMSAGEVPTKSMATIAQSPSLSQEFSSADTSVMMKSSPVVMKTSRMVLKTSIKPTSLVMATSSYTKVKTETPALSSFSQLTRTSKHFSQGIKSSQFLKNTQTSSEEHSLQTTPSSMMVRTGALSMFHYPSTSQFQQFTSTLESTPALMSTVNVLVVSLSKAAPTSTHVKVTATPTTLIVDNTAKSKGEDEADPVLLIVIPILAVLFLAAICVAFFMWLRHRKQRKSAARKNAENGSELSRKGLVESLENINNNDRTTGFVNRGVDDRASRSLSRNSSVSNLETIQEGNEPEEPEIYDL